MSSPNGLPRTAVVFPAPFPITLIGTSEFNGSAFVNTFDNQPDAPLSSVTVKLNGGSGSLLKNGWWLCAGNPTINGEFPAHSGRTATASAPVKVTGCPGS